MKVDSHFLNELINRLDSSIGEFNKFIDALPDTDISGTKEINIERLKMLANDIAVKAKDISKIKPKK